MTEPLEITGIDWRRVSPKYVVVDVIGYIIFALMVLVPGFFIAWWISQPWAWAALVALGIIFLLTIVLTPRRVRSIGYQLREDDLLFRRGIMYQRIVAVPFGRMQLVDINRGPLARALGLSELKFVTAAAASGVVIPGLPAQDAEELRDTLVALAESRRAGL
ncbi:PH domain-containing protein [Glaciihabitans arcticus]|uniref:PH domain-containing protein n=1 Tax=Glaciihabitans arcticus TaxID=2668039 RepID=A0A4Q9GXJ7_9MICO|nr:PH domain-containing protein [Glaciihabitans arcticus]TBN57967.1 PH domain-containing protein [Glaciihabitans arcticus]